MDGTPPIAGPSDAAALVELTPQSLIRLDYIAVPEDIAPHITPFFHLRSDEAAIGDVQPAVMGQLHVYLAGEGRMTFAEGRVEQTQPVTLMSPLSRAAPVEVDGPLDVFGVVLAPLGWAAMTGLDAAEHGERMFDAVDMLGPAADALGETIRSVAQAGGDDANRGRARYDGRFPARAFQVAACAPMPPAIDAAVAKMSVEKGLDEA